jgi:hypothetical protein
MHARQPPPLACAVQPGTLCASPDLRPAIPPPPTQNPQIGTVPILIAIRPMPAQIEHLFVAGSSVPSRRRHCRLAGGRVKDAWRRRCAAVLCPVLDPAAGSRDGSEAGRERGAGSAAGVVGCVAGPGVACPKSRWPGCEPAALDAEWFPGCRPGLLAWAAAARRASACRQAKVASLICRFRQCRASLPVLPSASFLSSRRGRGCAGGGSG